MFFLFIRRPPRSPPLYSSAASDFYKRQVNEEILKKRIHRSEESFNFDVTEPGGQGYLFVMEDTQTGQVVGTTGIEAAVGIDNPFYHYHLGKVAVPYTLLTLPTNQEV